MTIRITTLSEPGGTIIKVDGHLRGEAVGELARVCQESQGPLALDLGAVTSVDREAAAVLRELARQGAALRALSPYVTLLLEAGAERVEHGSDDTT